VEHCYSISQQGVCPQLDIGNNPIGEEDCLKLNVYVPDIVEDLMPVMVWIYGGGLETGSNNFGDYGPLRFLDKGILVVTIKYRLGPFGFLSLGTDIVPGNAGLLDQVLALKWVQDNIASFNGDSDKVTVFGESAGSASVAYHLLSPRSKRLFQRGIFQSGTALAITWGGYMPLDKAVKYSDLFTSNLLCSEGNLPCLQSKEMTDILAQTHLLDIPDDALLDILGCR
jgi:carboxylesterase type B